MLFFFSDFAAAAAAAAALLVLYHLIKNKHWQKALYSISALQGKKALSIIIKNSFSIFLSIKIVGQVHC